MAEGKKKQKKSPWWYKLGIMVFGAVFASPPLWRAGIIWRPKRKRTRSTA